MGNLHDIIDDEKDTIPRSESVSGTIESVNDDRKIVGSSTAFTTEFQPGDFIYIPDNDEVRKIRTIVDDDELTLHEAVSSTLSAGTSYKRVDNAVYRTISWLIDSDNDAKIDGKTFPSDASGTLSYDKSRGLERIEPVVFDSTPNGNKIYIEAKN